MPRSFLTIWLIGLLPLIESYLPEEGLLFPRESETREVVSLDGIWNFAVAPITDPLVGFRNYWYKKDLKTVDTEVHLMPVPSSYNDITQNTQIRDHVGLVWYDRTFFAPKRWNDTNRVWIRFSSVSYAAQVWINGNLVMNHEIGHLPFHRDISSVLNYGAVNRVTVACDNTLLADTVPQGTVSQVKVDDGTKYVQSYTFDFFNYAGIQRPVKLFTTPWSYIEDITVDTDIDGDTGIVDYNITHKAIEEGITCSVLLLDREDNVVTKDCGQGDFSGTLTVPLATLWWPYLMDPDPGYLYKLQVELHSSTGELVDTYRQPLGIRRLTWTNTSFLINNRPLYLHGFGRHEDSDIRGKGLDLATTLKDYNLIKWVGANVYRTSHYPYADEIMDLADELGIMIINECPSVDTDIFSAALLEKHKDSLTELIRRDKNRPSVIAWSIANEPRTQTEAAGIYFGAVAAHVRSLDTSRPITIAIARGVYEDKAGQHLDIISFNRYNAWYQNAGHLDMITQHVVDEATAWHERYNKPVLMSEYGADTLEGLHIYPEFIWSEEYQVTLLSKHFEAFDQLRAKGFFIGEFVWNFADFKTAQTYTRVGGNKKGIFTRNRQPKAGAHHIRRRYLTLASELYNISLPEDLYSYVGQKKIAHNEL